MKFLTMAYEVYWSSFLEKELTFYDTKNRKYLKKGYLHFDNRIWFPDFQEKFQKFITNPENVISHSFFPFLKVILKIKRRKGYNSRKHKRQIIIKERPICYAAHFDALIYSFYSTYLSEKYEEFVAKHKLNESVIAYRSLELCNIDFAKEVFDYISNKGECVAVALDIKGFFDNLNHEKLKENWLKVINTNEREPLAKLPKDQFKLFNSLSKYAYVEKTDLLKSLGLKDKDIQSQKLTKFCGIAEFRNIVRDAIPSPLKVNINKGIPQGSPISAVLSNVYMVDYDKAIITLKQKYNFIYRRYCDDIIIVCDIKDLPALKDELYREIIKLDLEIQTKKEEVVFFLNDKNLNLRGYSDLSKAKFKSLQYLGFEFNGQNAYIRSSSLSRFHRRMKGGVREAVKRAYGKKARGNRLFRKRLHERFTHLGGQNFLSYVYRASEIMNNSETIKKQVARHFDHLNRTIDQKTTKHLKSLKRKGKILSQKK
jgi:RNA-directed DNA polymerase